MNSPRETPNIPKREVNASGPWANRNMLSEWAGSRPRRFRPHTWACWAPRQWPQPRCWWAGKTSGGHVDRGVSRAHKPSSTTAGEDARPVLIGGSPREKNPTAGIATQEADSTHAVQGTSACSQARCSRPMGPRLWDAPSCGHLGHLATHAKTTYGRQDL